ncbi:carbon monoxide dehydrogenase [Planotetraspora thailandica]|uniref:Carbon monoxide dehydrogenase n=1 Tax=Planotetraspora thailandica TaxID=487172 RepID=A0A8J4DE51_9ACTN|nr:FAD binding domain-containing protein [Planotetraspora thailandica]GII58545.1 carbon monoxide dehydrogenase [Planotetraspora thailandica]
MKPAAFDYHRPAGTAEAVRLLSDLGDDAKVIAGGQSLLPIMNMRLAEPAHLVDVTGIAELRQTTVDASGARYGATTTHMRFEYQLVPDVTGGLLSRMAAGIGYQAIRNRGTVGGSLAHSDPSAEWPTVMAALDAAVHVLSVRGMRRVPVRDLLLGFFSTALEPDELIVDVEVGRLPASTRWGVCKTARKPGEFAESLAVALMEHDATPRIRQPRLWLGAAADTPVRLAGTERLVEGHDVDAVTADDLVVPIAADLGADPGAGDPAARYVLHLHAVTVHRALRAVHEEVSDE